MAAATSSDFFVTVSEVITKTYQDVEGQDFKELSSGTDLFKVFNEKIEQLKNLKTIVQENGLLQDEVHALNGRIDRAIDLIEKKQRAADLVGIFQRYNELPAGEEKAHFASGIPGVQTNLQRLVGSTDSKKLKEEIRSELQGLQKRCKEEMKSSPTSIVANCLQREFEDPSPSVKLQKIRALYQQLSNPLFAAAANAETLIVSKTVLKDLELEYCNTILQSIETEFAEGKSPSAFYLEDIRADIACLLSVKACPRSDELRALIPHIDKQIIQRKEQDGQMMMRYAEIMGGFEPISLPSQARTLGDYNRLCREPLPRCSIQCGFADRKHLSVADLNEQVDKDGDRDGVFIIDDQPFYAKRCQNFFVSLQEVLRKKGVSERRIIDILQSMHQGTGSFVTEEMMTRFQNADLGIAIIKNEDHMICHYCTKTNKFRFIVQWDLFTMTERGDRLSNPDIKPHLSIETCTTIDYDLESSTYHTAFLQFVPKGKFREFQESDF